MLPGELFDLLNQMNYLFPRKNREKLNGENVKQFIK